MKKKISSASSIYLEPIHSPKMTYPSEKFCLKWNDFQQNVVTSYQDLHKETDFSDVTLVCEEDHQIEAHRIILTACSPFFKTVLKKNKHSHPMIYMRGLKAKDLVAIIDFIYHGETNICQEDLDGFLALAEELQLRGLAGSHDFNSETIEEPVKKTKTVKKESTEKTFKVEKQIASKAYVNESESIDYKEVSYELVSAGKMLVHADMDNLKVQINSMMEKVTDYEGETKWKCTACAKVIKSQRDMGRHIETHIEGVSYPCHLCGAVKRSSNALNVHVTRIHRN